MKRRIFPLVATLALPLHARDLVPEYWLEDIPANDQSLQKCLVFRTVAGVGYRVESSADLDSWQTDYQLYGMGHEFVVPVHEIAPPPPPDPEEDPPPALPPALHVTLQLQPSSATEGGTVVTWKSLDHGGPVIYRIAEAMHADWQTVPLFAERHENHYFFITHPSLPAAPPAANPPLGPLDEAMIEVLEAHLDDMNETVANSAEVARNTPPPAPPSGDSRRFYRVRADWSVDTDLDRSPDWAEFEVAADASHPNHALANAFNEDQNGDGTPDGLQTDTDRDGAMDADDASPGDGLFNFPRLGNPRYALFETAGAEPPEGLSQPLQINDQGTVLFANGTWKAGEWQALDLAEGDLSGCRAFGMNDAGEIAGTGTLDLSPAPATSVVVLWSNPTAAPAAVSMGSGENLIHATPGYDMAVGSITPDSLFSNDGRLFAISGETWDDEGVMRFRILDRELWTLPGNGRQVGRTATAAGMPSLLNQHTYWGYDNETQQPVLQAPGNPPAPNQLPARVATRPGGGLIAFFTGRPGRALDGQTWKMSQTLGLASDLSSDGVAIGVNLPGKVAPVMYNGSWHAFSRVAPQAPAPWNEAGVTLGDTTAGGWILASAGTQDPHRHAAVLPLRVSGHFTDVVGGQQVVTTEFVGTDDFSAGSTAPGAALQDRLWINVPAGGSRTVTIKAPLTAVNPLTVEGTNLTFNGQNPSVTLSLPESTVAIHAAATVETGSEIPLDLNLGVAASASKPLGVKVMKPRTVKVSIHPVALKDGEEVHDPDFELTKADVEAALGQIFDRQVNVNFFVQIENETQVEWDMDLDGMLFANSEEDPEVAKILEEVPGSTIDANIRVFVIGLPPPAAGNEAGSNQGYLAGDKQTGAAYPDERRVWVSGSSRNGTRSPAKFYRTLAHEIGHVLLDWERPGGPGQGHPDQGGGVAPLPGTDHTRRLMVSGGGQGPNPGHLLVKEEWDRIELWLQNNIDQQ